MKAIRYPWTIAVGVMDTVTGLLLVIFPGWVMGLLGIPPQDHPEFLSWVGVFVGSVGLSYALAIRGGIAAETVWSFTALVRGATTVFLTAKMLGGAMPARWATVAATDAVVAAVQVIGLRAGWWRVSQE